MIRLLGYKLFRADIRTRMPFRYGIATMTVAPHVFFEATCELEGVIQTGVAAENLIPKWFTKDPGVEPAVEIDEMLRVIRKAAASAIEIGPQMSVFALWRELWARQDVWAKAESVPALLAHFGTSIVERAVIEAFCRTHRRPFAAALMENAFGMELGSIHGSLSGSDPADWLRRPIAEVFLRHTVGLSDPLTSEEIQPAERLEDGLPQSLDECIGAYDLRHFKLKVGGAGGLPRLRRVAAVLAECLPKGYACSLDGNEGFRTVAEFRAFWDEVAADPSLAQLRSGLMFVEQPFHRAVALNDEIGALASDWAAHPPIIIDESDAELTSLPRALNVGYSGTSHKNCKGVFKGVANACLLAQYRQGKPFSRWLLSGEDLTNIGPVALLQDLAVQATLGVESIERNGHHYFSGLSMWPAAVHENIRAHHPDLYEDGTAGWPTLRIRKGRLSTRTVLAAPFGFAFAFDPSSAAQLASEAGTD